MYILLIGVYFGEEVFLGILLLFFFDFCDGGGIIEGFDLVEGSLGNFFDEGSLGEIRKRYLKENICY